MKNILLILLLGVLFNANAQSVWKNSYGKILLHKYEFLAPISNQKDVLPLEEFLLKKEGIIFAKSDFPKKTFTLVCVDLIDENKIFQLCNKNQIKTASFKLDKLTVDDFLSQFKSVLKTTNPTINTGNAELDKYILSNISN